MSFTLHPQLEADTFVVTGWPLSTVLLMNDARYPWLILVPQQGGLTGLHQLSELDRGAMIADIARASDALEALHNPERINVAALGNMVPQLHVHVIARQTDDDAWPGPVWGKGTALAYSDDALQATLAGLRKALA